MRLVEAAWTKMASTYTKLLPTGSTSKFPRMQLAVDGHSSVSCCRIVESASIRFSTFNGPAIGRSRGKVSTLSLP